jgi:hypothetical protein
VQLCSFVQALKTARDSKEHAIFRGLSQHISFVSFVKNIEIMYDALKQLSELSFQLLNRDISLVDLHRSICLQERHGKELWKTCKRKSKSSIINDFMSCSPSRPILGHHHYTSQSVFPKLREQSQIQALGSEEQPQW